MFWGLMGLASAIWLAAVFYIIRGLGGPENAVVAKTKEEIKPEKEPEKKEEIEISISPPAHKDAHSVDITDIENFYNEFGRANIVDFPAEYIDKNNVKGISGNKINIIDFAKNCYHEIGFQSAASIMVKEEKRGAYRINIFDLIADHYTNTEESFVNFFGQLKDKFAQEIESIKSHPDMAPANKKALIGRQDALPQLIVWNKRELFLVTVKSKYDALSSEEIDFLKEVVIKKRLFKARIFRVTERRKPEGGEKKIETKEKKAETEKEEIEYKALGTKEDTEKIRETPAKTTRKPFTKEEIKFLKESRDKFTNEELAEKLGRSVDSITHKLSRTGIARESYEWTEDKSKFLKNNISKLSYRKLAEKLGATIPSIRARCKKLKIRK